MFRSARRVLVILAGVVVLGAALLVLLGPLRPSGGAEAAGSGPTPAGSATPAPTRASGPSTAPVPSTPVHQVHEPTGTATAATDSRPPATGGEVAVSVTYADWEPTDSVVEVGGFVSGVIESGGICRVTLTRMGTVVTAERAAEADVGTTSCGSTRIADPRLTPGTWTMVLSYRSSTSTGTAHPVTIEVPAR